MARRELKNSEKYKDVFMYEDLTQLRFKLMQMARKCDGVKSVHTRDGNFHCVLRNATDVIWSLSLQMTYSSLVLKM